MSQITIRSILAATDLGEESEAVVRSAAAFASATGAARHLLHSLDLREDPVGEGETPAFRFGERIEYARGRVEEQARSLVPAGVRVASLEVMVYSPRRAILDRAEQVAAELIVFGAHFLDTTADRVVRSARVPCLVTTAAVEMPIRSIGVPIDFSAPAQRALDFAAALAAGIGGEHGSPALKVLHVGRPPENADLPGREEEVVVRPELERRVQRAIEAAGPDARLRVESEVLWAADPAEATLAWTEQRGVELLVMGTHGRSGVRRALLGSVASSVSRRAPCAVLLVPPSFGRSGGLRPCLHRVVVGVDFSEASAAAARWTATHLAPDAETVLAHCVEVPSPPALLRGRWGAPEELARNAREGAQRRMEELAGALPRERVRGEVRSGAPADELVRLAEEADADMIVVGEHGHRRGLWDVLGSTAERVIHRAAIPVLVARALPTGPPRRLLVAIDGSDLSAEVLAWARRLRETHGARLTVFHAINLLGFDYAVAEPAGVSTPSLPEEQELRREATEELRARVREAGLAEDEVELRVVIGEARHEILSAVARHGTDLLVMGSRGAGAIRRNLLGSVASAMLRGAPCPVLVVSRGPGGE